MDVHAGAVYGGKVERSSATPPSRSSATSVGAASLTIGESRNSCPRPSRPRSRTGLFDIPQGLEAFMDLRLLVFRVFEVGARWRGLRGLTLFRSAIEGQRAQ